MEIMAACAIKLLCCCDIYNTVIILSTECHDTDCPDSELNDTLAHCTECLDTEGHDA